MKYIKALLIIDLFIIWFLSYTLIGDTSMATIIIKLLGLGILTLSGFMVADFRGYFTGYENCKKDIARTTQDFLDTKKRKK